MAVPRRAPTVKRARNAGGRKIGQSLDERLETRRRVSHH